MPKHRRHHGEESPETQAQPGEKRESPVIDLDEAYADVHDKVCSMFDIPDDFVQHVRAARREMLLAVRSLIDARIASIDEGDRRREAGRRTRVNIE